MAATVVVKELTGAGPTYTTCSSTATSYFRVSDAHGSSTPSYKIPIPASGLNHSYWKTYSAEVTANGDGNTLDNWNFYLADTSSWNSALGSSGSIVAGTSSGSYGVNLSNYVQATGESGSNGWNGKELVTDHGQIDAIAAAPTSATEFDNTSVTSTGSTSNFFTLQISIDTDATLGEIGELTAYIQYDES